MKGRMKKLGDSQLGRRLASRPVILALALSLPVFLLLLLASVFIAVSGDEKLVARNRNETAIDAFIDEANGRVWALDKVCLAVNTSKSVRALLEHGEFSPEDKEVAAVRALLAQSKGHSEWIDSIYIYYSKQNAVITEDGVFPLDEFPQKGWYKPEYVSIGNYCIVDVWENSQDFARALNIISINRCFPVYTMGNIGMVVVNMNMAYFENMLKQISGEQGAAGFFVNKNGIVQLSSEAAFQNGRIANLLGSYEPAGGAPYQTVKFRDARREAYTSGKTYFNWLVVQLFATRKPERHVPVLVFAGALALATGMHAAACLNAIRFRAAEAMAAQSELASLGSGRLDREKHSLAEAMAFALSGGNGDEKWRGADSPESGAPPGNYVIILLRPLNRRGDRALAFEEVLRAAGKFAIAHALPTAFGYAVAVRMGEKDSVREIVDELCAHLAPCLETVDIAAGNMVRGAGGLSLSYKNAASILHACWIGKKANILICQDMQDMHGEDAPDTPDMPDTSGTPPFAYKPELSQSVINAVKSGSDIDLNSAAALFFRMLVNDNQANARNVRRGFMQLLSEIRGFLIEFDLYEECGRLLENIYDNLDSYSRHKQAQYDITVMLYQITKQMHSHSKASSEVGILEVKEYVENHYYDIDITLSSVAQQFSMNESYLSRMFKQIVGENFLEFLNKQRINRSKRCLSETELTVNQISSDVGFGNVQRFIRAFKNVEGMTPGAYREYRRNTGRDMGKDMGKGEGGAGGK
jgi:AraC-like DNA-binding protein